MSVFESLLEPRWQAILEQSSATGNQLATTDFDPKLPPKYSP
ncbi:MAG: hypothetical protein O6931_08145 [Gammaproteobacteria bacterium]|nr:hypothetical protein [Gammaproteobacteria bacterium]